MLKAATDKTRINIKDTISFKVHLMMKMRALVISKALRCINPLAITNSSAKNSM